MEKTKNRKTADLLAVMDEIKTAKGNYAAAKRNCDDSLAALRAATRPRYADPTEQELAELLALCAATPLHGYPLSHVYSALCLYLFQPDALFGGKIRIALAKKVAGTLGVSHPVVYLARPKIVAWMDIYPVFRNLMRELYERAQGLVRTHNV